MALELPTSLSPSKVSTFKECALAFRFSAIDRLPEPPSLPATRGTLVHAALERLFCEQPDERTPDTARAGLETSFEELRAHPDYTGLALSAEDERQFLADADALVGRYFELEDPRTIHPIGIELRLELPLDGVHLRGVIDRLELDEEGELVVTDYKTGRAPAQAYEQRSLGGVQFYALLCERLFGKRPARVQLLHLAEPIAIVSVPTEQSTRALERRVQAMWRAIEQACERESFQPRPSKLCDWCAFKTWCPAFGGDPAQAPTEAALAGATPAPA